MKRNIQNLNKTTIKKIAAGEDVSLNEVVNLLTSRLQEYKSFGIKGVIDNDYKELSSYIKNLTKDRNELIASDALDCLYIIAPDEAIKTARNLIDSKSRYIQASSLFILGEYGSNKELQEILNIEKKYRNNRWRRIGFLEAEYKLGYRDNNPLDEIITILQTTKDYHTKCASINALERVLNKNTKQKILSVLHEQLKNDLSESVRSTIVRVFEEN